jgi:hypothetical protein
MQQKQLLAFTEHNNCQLAVHHTLMFQHAAHETAVCRTSPRHCDAGGRKNWTDAQQTSTPALEHVTFLRKYEDKHFVFVGTF